jgi:hypothetical protein
MRFPPRVRGNPQASGHLDAGASVDPVTSAAVKILGLMNSNASGGRANIDQDGLFQNLFGRALEKFIHEPVELMARPVWPTPDLPQVVGRWMRDFQPELVTFYVSSFWFLYESTPVRVERRLGRPGAFINQQAQKVAATPWLAHNRPFQWTRRQTHRLVGGQAWFEPDEVISRSTAVIREVLQHEGAYLVVVGPAGGDKWARDAVHLQRILARRQTVDAALASFCKAHHVEYMTVAEQQAITDPQPASLQGDELHLDAEGHRRVAEHYFRVGLGWAQRALEATREEATLASTHITSSPS